MPPQSGTHNVNIGKLLGGDVYTAAQLGTLNIGPRVAVTIIQSDIYMAAHINVHSGGRVQLPQTVHMYHTSNNIQGALDGVRALTLVGATLVLGGQSPNRTIDRLKVLTGGELQMTDTVQYTLSGSEVEIGAGGRIICRQVIFRVDTLTVNEGGRLDGDSQGDETKGESKKYISHGPFSSEIVRNFFCKYISEYIILNNTSEISKPFEAMLVGIYRF